MANDSSDIDTLQKQINELQKQINELQNLIRKYSNSCQTYSNHIQLAEQAIPFHEDQIASNHDFISHYQGDPEGISHLVVKQDLLKDDLRLWEVKLAENTNNYDETEKIMKKAKKKVKRFARKT